MTEFAAIIIKTEAEYEAALQRLEVIFDAKRHTPEGDELDLLSLVIDKYEKEHFMPKHAAKSAKNCRA